MWIPSACASQYSPRFIWPGTGKSLTLSSFDWLDKWTVIGCHNSVLLLTVSHCFPGLPPIPSYLSGCPWCSWVRSFLWCVRDRERRPEGATGERQVWKQLSTAGLVLWGALLAQESRKGGICLTGKTHNQKGQNCLARSNCSCHLTFFWTEVASRGYLSRLFLSRCFLVDLEMIFLDKLIKSADFWISVYIKITKEHGENVPHSQGFSFSSSWV